MVYVKNKAKRDTWYMYRNKFTWNESTALGETSRPLPNLAASASAPHHAKTIPCCLQNEEVMNIN
eukprot:14393252-Ditylum_brightwellii.AAC.1